MAVRSRTLQRFSQQVARRNRCAVASSPGAAASSAASRDDDNNSGTTAAAGPSPSPSSSSAEHRAAAESPDVDLRPIIEYESFPELLARFQGGGGAAAVPFDLVVFGAPVRQRPITDQSGIASTHWRDKTCCFPLLSLCRGCFSPLLLVASHTPPPRPASASVSASVSADALGETAFGLGALRHLAALVAAGALSPATAAVPCRVALGGALCDLHTGVVAGFDLSPLNAFRWHPGCAVLDAVREPKRWLSGAFSAADVDIGSFLSRAAAAGMDGRAQGEMPLLEGEALFAFTEALLPPTEAHVRATEAGGCTAAVLWVDAELYPGGPTLTNVALADRPEGCPVRDTTSAGDGEAATEEGSEVRSSSSGGEEGESVAAAAAPKAAAATVLLGSLKQAVWYFPEAVRLRDGQAVSVSARLAAGSRILLDLDPNPPQPPPQSAVAKKQQKSPAAPAPALAAAPQKPPRPRHALIHQWHHDMLNDAERNAAYRGALERAVGRLRAAGVAEARGSRSVLCSVMLCVVFVLCPPATFLLRLRLLWLDGRFAAPLERGL